MAQDNSTQRRPSSRCSHAGPLGEGLFPLSMAGRSWSQDTRSSTPSLAPPASAPACSPTPLPSPIITFARAKGTGPTTWGCFCITIFKSALLLQKNLKHRRKLIKHRRKLKSATLPHPRNDPIHSGTRQHVQTEEAGSPPRSTPCGVCRPRAGGHWPLCPLPKGEAGLATPRQAAQSAQAQGRGTLTSILYLEGSRARRPMASHTQSAQAQGMRDTDPPSSARGRRQSSWKVLPAPPGREAPTSPGAEGPRHTNLSD